MTDDLPENVLHIDALRINRGIEKRCKCENRTFVVDTQNHCVNCGNCGALVDPFEAMKELAQNGERLHDQTKALLEQRRAIANYKPHLIVIRDLERRYRGKQMLPCCPHCNRGIYLEELTSWVNRDVEDNARFWESKQT